MTRLGYIFIFLGLTTFTFGQKDSIVIKGKTLSEKDLRPLKNVDVIIWFHDKTSIHFMTKDNGEYYFKIKKCDCLVNLNTERNKQTSDGIHFGTFLPTKADYKIDLNKQDTFTKDFYFTEVIH